MVYKKLALGYFVAIHAEKKGSAMRNMTRRGAVSLLAVAALSIPITGCSSNGGLAGSSPRARGAPPTRAAKPRPRPPRAR